MRRRRRRKATWMPVLGHRVEIDEGDYRYTSFRVDIQPIPIDGEVGGAQTFFPIVPDFTEELTDATAAHVSLRDFVSGQAWRLERIVGKIALAPYRVSEGTSAGWPFIFLTAGFFVAKADDENQADIAMSGLDFAPNNVDNAMNPWIWRRTWMLNTFDSTTENEPIFTEASTQEFGSVMDGPHIDARSKRFINREHRLWMVINAAGYSANNLSIPGGANTQGIAGLVDLRVVGSLARQRNTSSF